MPVETRSITHAVVLQNHELAGELGRMLWSVLAEVSAYYNSDQQTRAHFDRKWVGMPAKWPLDDADRAHQVPAPFDGTWWRSLQHMGRLIDQEQFARRLREVVPGEESVVTVTDAEITPPPEWRYVIWESFDSGDAVISFAPLDPKYWGDRDPDRVNTIKRRVRAALLGVTGGLLGLEECDNTRCFLYKNVDSVSVLDNMIALGLEHGVPGLTNKVFAGRIDESIGLEALVYRPDASREYDPSS